MDPTPTLPFREGDVIPLGRVLYVFVVCFCYIYYLLFYVFLVFLYSSVCSSPLPEGEGPGEGSLI